MTTELANLLSEKGARLYVRQIMSRSAICEEQKEQEINRRAKEFWAEIHKDQSTVLRFPNEC